jgi:hypothetical protein
MDLQRAIQKAYQTARARDWDTIYVLVDCHDTIACSNYRDAEMEFYLEAIQALKALGAFPEVYLTLWTSCYEQDAKRILERLEELDVVFHSFNQTPVGNTITGCFDSKPYFSVLIDDKAGFLPEDWPAVVDGFRLAREPVIRPQTSGLILRT